MKKIKWNQLQDDDTLYETPSLESIKYDILRRAIRYCNYSIKELISICSEIEIMTKEELTTVEKRILKRRLENEERI